MHHLEMEYNWLDSPQAWVSLKHEGDKVIVFERAGLLFIFNFHPANSFTDYRVGVDVAGEYKIVLSSDDKQYGGFENVDVKVRFFTTPLEWNGRKNWLQVVGLMYGIVIRATHRLPSGLYPFPNKHSPCESLRPRVLRIDPFKDWGEAPIYYGDS
jgi:1,4-alpha-glucan branching enzyme